MGSANKAAADGGDVVAAAAGTAETGTAGEMVGTAEGKVQMTSQEADLEAARLRETYPVVKFMNAAALQREDTCLLCGEECPCMRVVAQKVLEARCGEEVRSLRVDDTKHRACARYVEVDGEPQVLLCAQPVERSMDSHAKSLLYHDALTGVYNRRFYEDSLRHQYMAAGVAIIDLDDFKMVNDTLGHHVGDLAIRTAAQAMLSCVRETDMLVRYGGDEFVLVLPGIASEDFAQKLKFMSKRVAETAMPGYPQVALSASIGGVLAAGRTIEDAVRQADKLMYKAKQQRGLVLMEGDLADTPAYHKPVLLIIDDSEMNREILKVMLADDYDILEADCGEKGLELLESERANISMVLLDIVMPGIDGFEVLSRMTREGWIDDIPVIMISSEDSDEVVLNAYELGASDYITRPFDARVVRHRVKNVMRLYANQRRLSNMLSQQFYERERESRMLVDIMAGVMELRNGESGKHVLHIRVLTEILLERLVQKSDRYDITGQQRATIAMASTLHDIGKMAIDDSILNKPGRLTPEEYEVMKTHTVIGAQMLERLEQYQSSELVRTAEEICRWHHERWDGHGYPDGLVGDEIPIAAQVVSLVDVYDALTSERVYKKAIPHEETMRMILDGQCGQFNPLLLECLVDVQDKIRDLGEIQLAPPQGLIGTGGRCPAQEAR